MFTDTLVLRYGNIFLFSNRLNYKNHPLNVKKKKITFCLLEKLNRNHQIKEADFCC